ncbi:MAG: class I SAM-dependent methyltransferase [Patescibacteria group bacterium]|nr:class I SAM-dependent methyltransferase [Patescibacteria group bacterium]
MRAVELFEKYKKGKHWDAHPTEYAERFADFLKNNNFHGLVVDIGCGRGRDVIVFKKSGFDALGIDISQDEIEAAQANCRDCRFDQQDAENLEFGDEEVSAFFMINIIHYLNAEKALAGIYRALTLGGYLFIHFNLSITDEKGNVDYSGDENDILKLVEKFKVIEKRQFTREDKLPQLHKHEILEFLLQKPIEATGFPPARE